MKKWISMLAVLILLVGTAAAGAESAAEPETWTTTVTARFATVEEGQQLMHGMTLFQEQITASTLPFYLRKKGGTVEEYIEYAAEQVLEFTPEEEKTVSDTLSWMQDLLERHGLKLPDPGVITFVKTTGLEMGGAAGYTSAGTIFIADILFMPEYISQGIFQEIIVHEIFHCLSRMYPAWRQEMYSLIHFTVLDEDIAIPEEIREHIIANPDVEHHDSTATFTVNGEKKECYLVFLTDAVFEKEGDDFFTGMYTGVVPVDGSAVYRVEEVEDFLDVIGKNTGYSEDPEEIMATNFAYTIENLDEGFGQFDSPEILEGIALLLKR